MWMVLPTPGSAVVVDRLARGRLAFDDLDQPMVSPRAAWRTAPRRSIVQLVRVVDVDPAPSLFACRIPVCTHMAESLSWLGRSEEHTSELQSLMRISYAVVCLK